jgi:hypothetical protein
MEKTKINWINMENITKIQNSAYIDIFGKIDHILRDCIL